MEKTNDLAIVLAAGRGSRLKINYPKPLFEIDNISIIQRISEQLIRAGNIDMLTVVGYQKEKIIRHLNNRSAYITQNNPRGTGDAVLRCLHHIKNYRNIFILVGDAPFITSSHISKLREEHRKSKSECSFLYSKFPFSVPYGRLKFSKSRELQ